MIRITVINSPEAGLPPNSLRRRTGSWARAVTEHDQPARSRGKYPQPHSQKSLVTSLPTNACRITVQLITCATVKPANNTVPSRAQTHRWWASHLMNIPDTYVARPNQSTATRTAAKSAASSRLLFLDSKRTLAKPTAANPHRGGPKGAALSRTAAAPRIANAPAVMGPAEGPYRTPPYAARPQRITTPRPIRLVNLLTPCPCKLQCKRSIATVLPMNPATTATTNLSLAMAVLDIGIESPRRRLPTAPTTPIYPFAATA